MNKNKLKEIQSNAKKIDCRINLFDGFCPKETKKSCGESLFWRYIVNIYGLLVDCDRMQIKSSPTLWRLLYSHSFISKDDLDFAKKFTDDITSVRKCFCHNTNTCLFYHSEKFEKTKKFLSNTFSPSSVRPKTIDEIQSKDWELLNEKLKMRFEQYLDILNDGLLKWEKSVNKEEVVVEWIKTFSNALFNDTDLISNIIAGIAQYEKINAGPKGNDMQAYKTLIEDELKNASFAPKDINEYITNLKRSLSNREILYEVIQQKRT